MSWLRRKAAPRGSHGGSVGVFGLDDRVLIDVSAWWPDMPAWVPSGRVDVLGSDVSDEELGRAVLAALEYSVGAKVVTDPKGTQLLLEKAGVKSRAALRRKARHVFASLSPEGVVELQLAVPEGGGWMSSGPEGWIRFESPSPEELGRALRSLIRGTFIGARENGANNVVTAGPFSFKTAWLAFRTSEGQPVVDLLAIRKVARRGWGGFDEVAERGVFVTPPVEGWTLAVGVDLAMAADRVDVAELSRRLGTEVQLFVTNRVVEGQWLGEGD